MSEFEVGDNVVYPPHGAGTVIAREVRGETGIEYLSIRVTHSKMTLMVPTDSAADKGVRKVMSDEELERVLATLRGAGADLPDNPQQRMRHNTDKARTGDVLELAEVIRDLSSRATGGKKLSIAEQNTLASAKQHLASEIKYVKGIEADEALAFIDEQIPVAEVESD